MRILLVEDEVHLAESLAAILKRNKYTVDISYDGESGLDNALSNIYDLILLDIMLPKIDGLSVLREFRLYDKVTPVIMLTAKSEVTDKITGLDCGADDYVPKPFNTDELLARIRAVGRREGKIISENSVLSFGDINLSTSLLKLYTDKNEVILTLKESELLEYFIHNSKTILSKEKIIEKLWGYESEALDNRAEVYVSFLRKKLLYIKSSVSILTIRGVGYKLCLEN